MRRYVHGAGSDDPIVWYEGSGINSSTRRFLMADERGSVVSVTDSAGATIAINAYDEYGIPAPTNVGRFGYTGQMWLPELKLWYYKARIYSPTLGRFLQTDPIGYKDGINWYAYVGNDPVNKVDPDGRTAGPAIGAKFCTPCKKIVEGASNLLFGDAIAAYENPTALNIAIAAVGLVPVGKGFTVAKAAGGRFIGRAQKTLRDGKPSGHAFASARAARDMIVTGKYVDDKAFLNSQLRTITGGDINSALRPDVAAVRPDGKVDIVEVLSPNQNANQMRDKYAKALGDRMGTFSTREATSETRRACTGTRICN